MCNADKFLDSKNTFLDLFSYFFLFFLFFNLCHYHKELRTRIKKKKKKKTSLEILLLFPWWEKGSAMHNILQMLEWTFPNLGKSMYSCRLFELKYCSNWRQHGFKYGWPNNIQICQEPHSTWNEKQKRFLLEYIDIYFY